MLPPLIFLVLYRFPFAAPRTWRAERRSVHLTNLSLVAHHGALAAMLGVGPVAAVLLAVIVPASVAGVWLFSLQHHFDGTHWARHERWDPVDAALRGSSFLPLPRLLQWVTGNIGFTMSTMPRHGFPTTGWNPATVRIRASPWRRC